IAEGNLIGNLASTYRISIDDDFTPAEQLIRHHLGCNDRNDDLVVANNVSAGRFAKCQAICLPTINQRVVHGEDHLGFAFSVALMRVVVTRSGRDKQALLYWEIGFEIKSRQD
ncbi:MAG: hypothetical protein RLZZ69_2708, partial [Cyanobacteriota bacterium]